MASPGNQHCANCIGTHSLPMLNALMIARNWKQNVRAAVGSINMHAARSFLTTSFDLLTSGPRVCQGPRLCRLWC